MADTHKKDGVRDRVRERYAEIATAAGGCGCSSAGCCTPDALGRPDASAKVGYSTDEMAAVPEGANMGLGCGNPQAIAALQAGECVVDLGCGGGFDCFLAAGQVGPEGRVIGVDMTPEMLAKARKNLVTVERSNIEFRLGEIEHLPIADNSADVIISNCVINLSPDKAQVFREAYRILREGGRCRRETDATETCCADDAALCGCISGAAMVEDLERSLADAGFADVQIRVKEESKEFIKDWVPGSGFEEYVRSASIEARKAAANQCCCSSPTSPDRDECALDAQATELIAIGASVAGHCQPCRTYHMARAQELGIADDRIRAAVDVGHMVEKGAMSAMRTFSRNTIGASSKTSSACCCGTPSDDGGTCCE